MKARFVLSLIGRLTPMTAAFILSILAPTPQARVILFVGSVTLLVVSEYFGIFRPLQNIEETRKRQLDFVIKPWLEGVRYQRRSPKLRVNVMLVRWRFGWRFYQFYQLNMDGDADANLSFSVNRGFCGDVFRNHSQKAKYRDLRKMSIQEQSEAFGWKDHDKTTHLKAIACSALYKETKTLRGAVRHRYFGVLNIDAIDDDGAEFLGSTEALNQVTKLAKFVQVTFPD